MIDIWGMVQESIKSQGKAKSPLHKSLPQGEGLILESPLPCEVKSKVSPLPCVRVVQEVGKNPQNKANSAVSVIDSANCANFAESNPPPISPSAREGEIIDSQNLADWKLAIVGDGILKSEIQAKIHALNLQDSIILKPFTKDIEREYLGASIYAMSSHFEGFGMVLAEACSYALPCIAFDIATGPSDIITHNKSGYLIADNDLESYAKHLIALMSDENLRSNFGAESKRRVGERFSQSVVIQKWQELLENKG